MLLHARCFFLRETSGDKLFGPGLLASSLMLLAAVSPSGAQEASSAKPRAFDSEKDLISLHYDHAPDKDDGHSAAADRTILQTRFGADWIAKHAILVSGAYGTNRDTFDVGSDNVMQVTWGDCGGWLSAHKNWKATVDELTARWSTTLDAGGDVWVKEGGQSDITADVVKQIKQQLPDVATAKRIHVVQHSKWNEDKTTPGALSYTKEHTDYIKISDANRYLNVKGGNAEFVQSARAHPLYGSAWKAAFDYYDPKERLDFSDTGELMHILGLGEIGIKAFEERFLAQEREGK